jgi:CDP-glucose 4,6-dehydratase
MFRDIFEGKKILITGHTGFKGTWLTMWLLKLGANVIGLSKGIPTQPSMFEELHLKDKIIHYEEDIRDLSKLQIIIVNEKPDFIFHLAAQAIVSISYSDPIETISSNVMGTTHILEALRQSNHSCTAIIITSDKCYNNVEQIWGYKENDQIGGKDVYSGSKGAVELIIKSYFYSFFKTEHSQVKLAVGRAGNVIGGGDWAKDRIIVDCMKAWSNQEKLEIRSPKATRPWQHVLEPLSGYLSLAASLFQKQSLQGESFNFGPKAEQNRTVQELLEDLGQYWHFENQFIAYEVTDDIPFHEAELLKLNCDKALSYLKWEASLEYHQTIKFTSEWYFDFYKNDIDMYQRTYEQIESYEKIALEKKLSWTQ